MAKESKILLRDLWESEDVEGWQLEEAKPDTKIDGKVILGVVRGPFFCTEAESKNKRYYTKRLWEEALGKEDLKRRLKDKVMYGCIGHDETAVTEKDLAEGRASHIVTQLSIDGDGKGMGEAVILGTKSGANLYIYLKAGSKLKTSSRATGKYESTPRNGVPVVDTKTFELETFDFVINAGFPQTDPRLSEEHKPTQNVMDANETLIAELRDSRTNLQTQLTKTLVELSAANGACAEATAKLIAEQAKVTAALAEQAKVKAIYDLVGFQTSGDLAKIFEVLGLDKTSAAFILEKKITAAMVLEWHKLGPPGDIAAKLGKNRSRLVAFEAIHPDPKEIETQVEAATRTIKAYTKLGSIAEISKVVTEHRRVTSEAREKALSLDATKLSEMFAFPLDKARANLAKMSFTEAVSFCENLGMKPKKAGAPKSSKKDGSVGLPENRAARFFAGQMRAAPRRASVSE